MLKKYILCKTKNLKTIRKSIKHSLKLPTLPPHYPKRTTLNFMISSFSKNIWSYTWPGHTLFTPQKRICFSHYSTTLLSERNLSFHGMIHTHLHTCLFSVYYFYHFNNFTFLNLKYIINILVSILVSSVQHPQWFDNSIIQCSPW